MAYFDKIKKVVMTTGVASEVLARKLVLTTLREIVQADYLKDYFQIVEIEKVYDDTLKIIVRQEDVNENIKESKIEFFITDIKKELISKFNIKKMYLIEDEEYEGVSVQTFLLPEEY